MWRRNILQKKREEIKQTLSERLFILDDVFGPIIVKHRSNCQDMKELRVIDMQQKGISTMDLSEFEKRQSETRENTTEKIQKRSDECRREFT